MYFIKMNKSNHENTKSEKHENIEAPRSACEVSSTVRTSIYSGFSIHVSFRDFVVKDLIFTKLSGLDEKNYDENQKNDECPE